MSAIKKDAPTDDRYEAPADDFDGEAAFAQLDDDAEKPSEDSAESPDTTEDNTEETDNPKADDAEDSDESPEDEANEDEGDESAEDDGTSVQLTDETKIKHKVDGEEREFTLGQLKRLAGQEASLTRKSQEVATKAKEIETAAEAQLGTLDSLLKHAEKQWEPYSKINFLAAAKDPNISAEELEAAQNAAQAAWDHKEFVKAELSQSISRLNQKRSADLQAAASECIKVLGDPEKGIKGWNKEVYSNIREYAQREGIAREVMDELVDPAAYKLIHKAMLFDKGKAAVKNDADAKAKTKKANKAPQKIVKNQSSPKTADTDRNSSEAALKRLQKSGSIDDAAAAWASKFAG